MPARHPSQAGRRLGLLGLLVFFLHHAAAAAAAAGRERSSLNSGWRFQRFESNPDGLSYDVLKPWLLPSANGFIVDGTRHVRPSDEPAAVEQAAASFDDSAWALLNVPHDWAIEAPFYTGPNPVVGGNMGRLPSHGVGWYRRTFSVGAGDKGKTVYLEVDGAMSYAAVWLNGHIVGGWPYGYASFRLDLTPYLVDGDNQLAIRLDQPLESSRWYPGGGIYRDVWLTKVKPAHVGQWGTFVTTSDVSAGSAKVGLVVQVENSGAADVEVSVVTDILFGGAKVATIANATVTVAPGGKNSTTGSAALSNPKLWGPKPNQEPNLHVAVTRVYGAASGELLDEYETTFGVRSLRYAGDGLYVNGERIYLKGVCQHHDLGSLGAAFNVPAARRQLEMLVDMGSNAVRTSHNPPAPELLDLADRLGILVLDEIFDTWAFHKTDNDFARIFQDWSEADLRAFIRRDRNHASVWAWSYGNEVHEQRVSGGEAQARRLHDIVKSEDATRQATLGMNNAGPDTAFTGVVDIIGLNYQGEGKGHGAPTFENFRGRYPDKMIYSTESSSVISSRGTYLFPVTSRNMEIVSTAGNGTGADPSALTVSSYDLYAVEWGATPDKVFAAQDRFPYVGGEFVWTGWDYVGEPTPFDGQSRSSYFGIIDMAGFPKDRFYMYQARWNPDVPMAHILPHWNWPDRVGQVTPVHVYSSASEAELFVNGVSQGRKTRAQYEYRFRWDDVRYAPGEVHVATYKAGGSPWANATVRTTGPASRLLASSYHDKASLGPADDDLAFISVAVADAEGDVVHTAEPTLRFSVSGPGELVTTDNGDQADFSSFRSPTRKAFRGLALAIVRAKPGAAGEGPIVLTVEADGLEKAEFRLAKVAKA
ncbi:hypothetical protein RB597_008128 [Gaeumannomyces tritici]